MTDTAILGELIVGRVEPRIYAFTTNTVPNYLKVGDTYRPVDARLDEWREHFPHLKREFDDSAKIGDVFFRDYSVHVYLEETAKRPRLAKGTFPGVYYSNEFFEDATKGDVKAAIGDIRHDFETKGQRYQFYSVAEGLPTGVKFPSTGMWTLRPNQDAAVKRFQAAIAAGRKNLLMYAVMRFGKSFTSMCCAKTMNDGNGANIVLVLSAKADVCGEWKKTVESAENFRNDYEFLSGKDLKANDQIVSSLRRKGKKVVIFLTLQDLQTTVIKKRHRDLFNRKIDLLIADETHYGARAGKYGEILRKTKGYMADKSSRKDDEDSKNAENMDAAIKAFKVNVTLHLSGTPYRILMGSEFDKKDIIAFCPFTDIANEQKKWNDEHILDDQYREWDNPYFGFPEMIRFAFHPNKSARMRLEALRKDGATYAFSAFFAPESIVPQADGSHRRFKFEKEIRELFQVIDGSKDDDELLGFLDYDKIKIGMMCRHLVCVLPYCASCDALAELIARESKKGVFKNLAEYQIINIAGHDMPPEYANVEEVKKTIRECEQEGKKTLTLTVNRMLTGSTVPEWDTMLYFKDTSSPQEYDQAIFRLQNQFVTEMKTALPNGREDVIKFNKKPQTILVDFDPARLFEMQEEKSKIYNANEDKAGNTKLKARISAELAVSPIVCVTAGKIRRVDAEDVMKAVSDYSRNRGVTDEAAKMPVDVAAAAKSKELLAAIMKESPLGSKGGLTLDPHKGEGEDLENMAATIKKAANGETPDGNATPTTSDEKKALAEFEDKFRAYYARLLFFAFLTKSKVCSVEDIIACMDKGDNARIATNLEITKPALKAIQKHFNKFILSEWDYKIDNLNTLSRDESLAPLERAQTAIRKFDRLGVSEIMTPEKIADDMVALFPAVELERIAQSDEKILDIASKAGEFAIALYKRYKKIDPNIDVSNLILSIPTSSHVYEFTRNVYAALGLNLGNIAEKFTSYDLLKVKTADGEIDYGRIKLLLTQKKPFRKITMNDKVSARSKHFTIAGAVGNPPYQEIKGEEKLGFASAIYPYFMNAAFDLSEGHTSMIVPSRWIMKTGQGINEAWADALIRSNRFLSVHDFHDAKSCFPGVEIKGGVMYFDYKKDYEGKCSYVNNVGERSTKTFDFIDAMGCGIVIRDEIARSILGKIVSLGGEYFRDESFAKYVGPTHLFDKGGQLGSSWSGFQKKKDSQHSIKYYLNKRVVECGFAWIKPTDVPKGHNSIPVHKVYVPEAYGAGEGFPHQILGVPFYGEPNSVCSQTYLCIGYDPSVRKFSKEECKNIVSYIKTRFLRYLVSLKKNTQHSFAAVYQFVPLQDFTSASDIDWSRPVPEIDAQLYAKYGITKPEQQFIESLIKPME